MAELTIPFTAGSSGYKQENYQDTGASGATLWNAIYNGAGDSSGSDIWAGWLEGENWNVWLKRAYMQFDTSVLDGANITAAKLVLSGQQFDRNVSESCQIGSFPSNNYADLKTTTDYVELPIQSGLFSGVELSLTGAGLASIDSSGVTNFSFRGTGDTTNRGTTSTDDYTYVKITSASLVVEHDPLQELSDSVGVTDEIEFSVGKTLSEQVLTGERLETSGGLVGVMFSEGITTTDIVDKTFVYALEIIETLKLDSFSKKLQNGVATSKWLKAAKDAVTRWI